MTELELAIMEESEDGGAGGVGEDLDVCAGAFAAGGAIGGEGQSGFDVVFNLGDVRSQHWIYRWWNEWG